MLCPQQHRVTGSIGQVFWVPVTCLVLEDPQNHKVQVKVSLKSGLGLLRSSAPIRGLNAQEGLDCFQGNTLWGLDVHGGPVRSINDHNSV